MSRLRKGPGPLPEVPATFWFKRMDAAQDRGDYIAAGRAQEALERLGWRVRRTTPDDPGDRLGEDEAPIPAEAVSEPEVRDDEADGDWGVARADQPQALTDVVRLVGVTVEELEEAIEAGRFPLPDGYVSGRPYWDRDTIGWWVKRGTSL